MPESAAKQAAVITGITLKTMTSKASSFFTKIAPSYVRHCRLYLGHAIDTADSLFISAVDYRFLKSSVPHVKTARKHKAEFAVIC
ncbi:hypothetical protein SDC9_144466 [bioreactor metagenome]|uniref:Uncharacterized protein n=1 Tax=bioreactor metagenome TaxID=1076179 RepID=A0A645E906_9ZZZZ